MWGGGGCASVPVSYLLRLYALTKVAVNFWLFLSVIFLLCPSALPVCDSSSTMNVSPPYFSVAYQRGESVCNAGRQVVFLILGFQLQLLGRNTRRRCLPVVSFAVSCVFIQAVRACSRFWVMALWLSLLQTGSSEYDGTSEPAMAARQLAEYMCQS